MPLVCPDHRRPDSFKNLCVLLRLIRNQTTNEDNRTDQDKMMNQQLNTRSGLITVVLYMLGSIIAGVIAAIFLGGLAASPDERLIDNVIDSSMYANILISFVLLFVCFSVFKGSTREIFFESKRFSVSKAYYIYPLILLGIILWALSNVDFAAYSINVILLVMVATLAIGFNEEVVTRGILLVGMRNSGVQEWKVFAITTVIFGLLHSINLLGGSNPTQILVTLAGGVLFYVSRRVANNLFVPIGLHALYDTGFFLLSGMYAQAAGSLPDFVLDIHLGSFLILLIASIGFLIFGRGLLKTETAVPA